MLKRTIYAYIDRQDKIYLGRQLESNYRTITFDCSKFGVDVESITLVHQRSRDVSPYLIATSNTDELEWVVSDTDTAYDGTGQAEVRIAFSNGLVKSVIYPTVVVKSITADTVIPEPLQSWYDAMIDYINEHSVSPEEVAEAVDEYLEEHPVTVPVTSVNSKLGDVVLNATDVGALPSSTEIPSKTSDLVNDSGFISTETDPAFTASPAHGITAQDISEWNAKSDFSGDYNDLSNKPVIPTVPTNVSAFQNDAGYLTAVPSEYVTETELNTALAPKANTADLATVATSGDYADLSNKPTIPTVPSNVSAFTNDAHYITASGAPVQSVNGQTGAVTVSVPTKTSDLTNDSGFITSAPVSSVDGKTGAVTVIPTGGSAGQVLAKASATDRDVEWITPSGGGGGSDWQVLHDSTTTADALLQIVITDISVKEVKIYAIEPAGYTSTAVIYCPINNSEGNHYDKGYGRPYVGLSNAGSSTKIFFTSQKPIEIDGIAECPTYSANAGGQVNTQVKIDTQSRATRGMTITSLSVATYVSIPAGIRIVVLGR